MSNGKYCPAVAESRQKADALVESLGFEKSRKKGRMKGLSRDSLSVQQGEKGNKGTEKAGQQDNPSLNAIH